MPGPGPFGPAARGMLALVAFAFAAGAAATLLAPPVAAEVYWGAALGGAGLPGFGDLNPGLAVTNPSPTAPVTVTVTTAGGPPATFVVPASSSGTYTVPVTFPMGAYLGTEGTYRVHTSGPAAVTQFTPLAAGFENDATRLLAEPELGTTHYVHAFGNSDAMPSFLTVVAIANATSVEVTPSTAALGPGGTNLPAGTPQTYTLDQFGNLQIRSASATPLTGTRITATQRVALFGGAVLANVGPASDGDRINEQVPSASLHGTAFVACATAQHRATGFDRIEVMAVSSLANVDYQTASGGTGTLLLPAAGTWQAFDITEDIFISASAPISVAQYFGKSTGTGVTPGGPSMVLLTPVNQQDPVHHVFGASGWTSTRIQVAKPAAATVTLDGVAVTGWRTIGSSGYQCASPAVTAGRHVVSGTQPIDVSLLGTQGGGSYWYVSSGPPTEQPLCSISPQPAQVGLSLTATVTGGLAPYTWLAPGAAPSSGSGSSFTTTYNSQGSKTITVSGGGGGFCSVMVYPALECSAQPGTVAPGQATNLTATGGSGTYSWSAPGGSPATGTGTTWTTSFATSGVSTVQVQGGLSGSCIVTVAWPSLACTAMPPSVEVGQAVALYASGGSGTYGWSAPDGDPNNGSGASFATTFATAGVKTVLVQGGGAGSCRVHVRNPTVVTPPAESLPYPEADPYLPERSLSAPQAILAESHSCGDWVVRFADHSFDMDGAIVLQEWELDGTKTQGAQLHHRFPGPGTYTVQLRVTDDNGLAGTAQTTIDLRPCSTSPATGAPPKPPVLDETGAAAVTLYPSPTDTAIAPIPATTGTSSPSPVGKPPVLEPATSKPYPGYVRDASRLDGLQETVHPTPAPWLVLGLLAATLLLVAARRRMQPEP